MKKISSRLLKAYKALHRLLVQFFCSNEVDPGLLALNDYLRLENMLLRGCLTENNKKIRCNAQERWMLDNAAALTHGRSKNRICTFSPSSIINYEKREAGKKHSSLATRNPTSNKIRYTKKIKNQILYDILRIHPDWGKEKIFYELKKYFPRMSKREAFDMIYDTGMWINPKKKKGIQWFDFMNRFGKVTWAGDLFTNEVWTDHGQITYHTLFFVNLVTQEVFIAGTAEDCTAIWIERLLRWYSVSGEIPFDKDARCLIRDRDSRYSGVADWYFMEIGLTPKKISPGAPIMNFPAESFVRCIKHECLLHCIFLSGEGLRSMADTYAKYYNTRRPNRYFDGGYINEENTHWNGEGKIVKVSPLPGIITYYYRDPLQKAS